VPQPLQDWTRCPLPIGVFPSDWRAWFDVDTFLRAHAKVLSEQGSNMMASLALVLSVLALGSVSPTLRSTDGHALSSAIFWAAIKALAYCQSPGSNDSKVSSKVTQILRSKGRAQRSMFTMIDHVG
jgi:hypothetical protein